MADGRRWLERAALVVLLASGIASNEIAGWLGLAALAVVVGLLGERTGGATFLPVRVLRPAGDLLVAATCVFAFVWTLYPVISEQALRRAAVPLAYALAVVALVGLAAAKSWPPARTLVPAALALLLLGAQLAGPGPRFALCLGGALLGATVFLLCERPAMDRRAMLPRLGALIGFLAAVALLGVGIGRFLPWAQPLVEGATVSLLATSASSGYAGFSQSSRLGDIEELALSRKVVLRAYTDTPQRLRGTVYTRFDGRAWAAEPARAGGDLALVDAAALPPPLPGFFDGVPGQVWRAAGVDASASLVRTRIVQSSTEIPTLLAPLAPALVGVARSAVRLDDHGILTPAPPAAAEIYAIANRYGGPARGVAAPELTLQLPESPDPRVRDLAETLGGAEGSPDAKVRRTLHHLERCCRYSLKVPRSTSRDPIAGFLFETKRGYCEYFASSAALLLRMQGVPTRYVTGFNVRDESLAGGHYAVRESDAHAWIESYVEGSGWLEFDPTPSAQYAEVHADSAPGLLARLLERVLAVASELGARVRGGTWDDSLRWVLRGLAPAALAAGAILGLVLLRRVRWRAAAGPASPAAELDPRIAELLARVDRACARGGRPRPPARAPLEHLEALPPQSLSEGLRAAATDALACFYRARYGGEQPRADELQRLLSRLPV